MIVDAARAVWQFLAGRPLIKTSVSPRSSPLGTFRAKRPSVEERGETDVFRRLLFFVKINDFMQHVQHRSV